MQAGYYNQMYNPLVPYQNRLGMYEQQQQMQMPYQGGQPNVPMQYQNNAQNAPNQQSFLKGRAVTSFDEAKASMIDLDGSLFVFTDVGNGKIYTKQIMLDGTAQLHTYSLNDTKPVEQSTESTQSVDMSNYVSKEELNNVVTGLLSQIEQFKQGMSSVPITKEVTE